MYKKIISFVLIAVIFSITLCTPTFAYEPTGFDVTAKTGLLASADTGEILFSRNIDTKVYPASITKIMTVILMLESEKYNPDAKIAMSESVLKTISGTGSSVSNLKAGEEISQLDLAYLVLMASFGDCAYLVAEYYGGSIDGFVDMMNNKASELGLKNTKYQNPVGLHDENNYTTAKDTLTLTLYALKNETFKKICETTRYTLPATNFSKERTISTTIFLQDTTTNYFYQYAKGVKTGYTDEAGRCLVSTAEYNGYSYVCVLFGCPVDAGCRHEFEDSRNLYKWAFNNFELKEVATTKNPICEVGVDLSFDTDFLQLYIEKNFMTVMPKKADESTVTIEPHLFKETVDAPVKKGTVLGTADVIYAEKKVGTVNLVAGQDVERSFLLFAVRGIKRFFLSKYMIAVYVLIGVLIVLFFVSVYNLNKKSKKKRKVKYIPYDGNDHSK